MDGLGNRSLLTLEIVAREYAAMISGVLRCPLQENFERGVEIFTSKFNAGAYSASDLSLSLDEFARKHITPRVIDFLRGLN